MILPRGLVFIVTIWIFAAWWICIGIRPPIQPTIASYLPGIRIFFAAITIGLCVAWPMLRLSERPAPAPIRQVLIDFLTIVALLHMVIWPLRLATNLPPQRMGLIDLFLFSWGAIIAAILAKSIGSRSSLERLFCMIAIVLISLMGPIAHFFCARMDWPPPPDWLDGPIMGVLRETLGGGSNPDSIAWRSTMAITLAAFTAWMAVFLLHLSAGRMLKTPSPNPS